MYEEFIGATPIESVRKANDYELDVLGAAAEALYDGNADDSSAILSLYEEVDDAGRAILDAAFVALCGRTMMQLIMLAGNDRHGYFDDNEEMLNDDATAYDF